MNSNYYLNRFKVTVPQLERLVGTALSRGGDYSDLYFEYSTYYEMRLMDSEVTSGGFHSDYGVGIRVLKGERTGYAYSENTDMNDMLDAAKAASKIAYAPKAGYGKMTGRNDGKTAGRKTYPATEEAVGGYGRPAAGASPTDVYPVKTNWRDTEAELFIPVLKKLEQSIISKDSRVAKVIARLSFSESEIMMYNSFGELTYDFRPLASLVVSAIFTQNGANENKSSARSFRMGAEMITDTLIEEMAEEVVRGIDARFEAKRPKGGKMPVVMGAGASGILLHEAMGHSFEADFIRKKQSIFSGKTGKRICAEGINIVDDGTLPSNRGACNYDDEGIVGQKTYMVRDGILESYLHDRISANYFGLPSTGNGRRESFRFNPIPRMRATYMESGQTAPSDIIASVKKGIYVDEFSNGQVKIGEGDFTFYVKSGFLIENGRLTAPVKDINIIGNGPKALADITAVGNDGTMDNGTWTCGKEQSVAVSCGIPTVLIKSLTIGGE